MCGLLCRASFSSSTKSALSTTTSVVLDLERFSVVVYGQWSSTWCDENARHETYGVMLVSRERRTVRIFLLHDHDINVQET